MLILIDADPLVYAAGFAAETHGYFLVVEGPEGQQAEAEFWPEGDKTAGQRMKEYLAANPGTEVLHKEMLVKAEPPEHATQIAKTMIEGIVSNVCERFKRKPREVTVRVLLSGPGNFRDKLATIKPYKGNREESVKPVHYQIVRNYLTEYHNAQVVHGREADDEVSIAAIDCTVTARPYVVATTDKDLDQVVGWHYNYKNKAFYHVTADDGRRRFWEQVLSGDSTDNIPGCYKIGDAKAAAKVAALYELAQDEGMDEQATESFIWHGVVATYEASKDVPGCPYADKFAWDVALETARLVYMQRRENELWVPPGYPEKDLEDYWEKVHGEQE